MNVSSISLSRRSITIAAALGWRGVAGDRRPCCAQQARAGAGQLPAIVSRAEFAANAVPTAASRLALVIGNGHYPDANAPLAQPINDARALTAALRRNGFDVDVVEDASKDDMARAIGRLKAKIKPDSVVMLFFGGYGVQVGGESYMIPVDAAIWKESDVRRDGFSVEAVLETMKQQGAKRQARRHRRFAPQPL